MPTMNLITSVWIILMVGLIYLILKNLYSVRKAHIERNEILKKIGATLANNEKNKVNKSFDNYRCSSRLLL